MKHEPAVIRGIAVAVVTAIINLVVAFGLDLTTEQQTGIISLVSVVALVVASLWTRQAVTPVVSLEENAWEHEHGAEYPGGFDESPVEPGVQETFSDEDE